MGLFAYLKKNRIKILKILIAIGVLYFSACVILQMISILFTDIYNIITLTYILILILCNFVVEFSPYFLNNYLVFIFPFLSHYSGRGAMYILIGIAAISPELDKLLNFGGYALIAIGLLCLYINWLIVKNFKLEYQDFEVMKDNYQDFNDESQKDSLTFPKFITNYDNISERNSINGNEKENDKVKETALVRPSMALNMKRLITVGEFQIELQILLEILEFSLNDENKENKNYLEKYVNDISLVSDDNSDSIDDSAKIKKFGDSLEKKYHKISLLLKRYLKENNILNGIIEKEKKNNGEKKKHTESKRRRRSLFDRVPLFFGSNDKNIQQMPNFGNTLLSEMKEDIEKKQKRYSYANIGKIEEEKVDDVENGSGSENSVDEDDNEDENDENLIYRPGRLRSSLCVDDLFAC